MKYRVKGRQVSYGEAIGIVLLENYAPFIPGDVANATTYDFPVRFQRVENFSVERIFKHDMSLLDPVLEAGRALVREGVRAVTGDCGFMVIYQKQLAAALEVPVFMSSLLQISFLRHLIGADEKIGIVTANSESLDDFVLQSAGVDESVGLVIRGLQDREHFAAAVIKEEGLLDAEKVEEEVVTAAGELTARDPKVRIVLLECSMLAPYAAAIQEAVGLPVFDFITMINYVFSAVVQRRYQGFM
jgi:Asp/Glu/hydantoin racemase